MTEEALFLWIFHTLGTTPFVSSITIFFAQWFPYIIPLFVVAWGLATYDFARLRKKLLHIFAPAFIAFGFVEVIKFLVPLPRPYVTLDIVPLVSDTLPLGSFPSAHAAFFAALSVAVYISSPREGKWFFLFAIIIAFARIGVGVHWPHDVLAGLLFGFSIGLLWSVSFCVKKG